MPTITEDQLNEAFQFAQAYPDDPGVQEKAGRIRDAYTAQQRGAGKPLFSREAQQRQSQETLRKFYQDRERHGLDEETFRQFGRALSQRPEAKYEFFNERFFSESFGLSKDQSRTMRKELLEAYSTKTWGEPVTDDKAFYDRMGQEMDREDEVARRGRELAMQGETGFAADAAFDFDYGSDPNLKARSESLRKIFRSSFDETKGSISNLGISPKEYAAELQQAMGVGEAEGKAMPDKWFVETVLEMPRDRQTLFLEAVAAQGGEGEAKSLGRAVMERVWREGARKLRGISNAGTIGGLESLQRAIVAGRLSSTDIPEDYGFDPLDASFKVKETPPGEMGIGNVKVPAPGTPEFDALSDDQKKALARIDKEVNYLTLGEMVRGVAEGSIDPAKGSNWYTSGVIGVAGMAPSIALMAGGPIGAGLNIAAYGGQATTDYLAEHPTASIIDATNIGMATGVIQGILDKIPTKIIAGKTPFFSKWLSSATLTKTGLIGRGAVRFGAGTAFEVGQEFGQDVLAPGFVEELANVLKADLADANWDKRLEAFTSADSMSELIPSIVMLSLIGTGVGGVNDYRGGWQLVRSKRLLTAAGLDQESVDAVHAAAIAGDAQGTQTLLRDAFVKLDKGPISEVLPKAQQKALDTFKAELEEKKMALFRLGQGGSIPQVVPVQGGFDVVSEDGVKRTFATLPEAEEARSAYIAEQGLEVHEDLMAVMSRLDRTATEDHRKVRNIEGTSKTVLDSYVAGETSLEEATGRADIYEQVDDQGNAPATAAPKAETKAEPEFDIEGEYQEAKDRLALLSEDEQDRLAHLDIIGESSTEFSERVEGTTRRLTGTTTVTLRPKASWATIIEEDSEGDAKFKIKAGRRDWLAEKLFAVDADLRSGKRWLGKETSLFKNGVTRETATDQDLIEAYSTLTVGYFVGTAKKGVAGGFQGSAGFRKRYEGAIRTNAINLLDPLARVYRAVAIRATKIAKMRRDGKLDAELERELMRSVGMTEQNEFDTQVAKEKEAIQKELDPDGVLEDPPMTVVEEGEGFSHTVMPDGMTLSGPGTFSVLAHHGTPHKVDKFKTAKIGTGEGAQAYGWGLYFGGAKSTGEYYKTVLSKIKQSQEWTRFSAENPERANDFAEAVASRSTTSVDDVDLGVELQNALAGYRDYGVPLDGANRVDGNLYTVELLPDADEFLDWDKPWSKQSEKVRSALSGLMPSFEMAQEIEAENERLAQAYLDNPTDENDRAFSNHNLSREKRFADIVLAEGKPNLYGKWANGSDIYSAINPGAGGLNARSASEFLLSLGIPGIRYLDGNSRSAGEGSSNYVIFDEKLVRILEENGQPVETQSERSFSVLRSGSTAFSEVLVDAPLITMDDLIGINVFPIIADLTAAGGFYRGIDSSEIAVPVEKHGGPFFPLLLHNINKRLAWASQGKSVLSQKGKRADAKAYGIVVAMSQNAHVSNTSVISAILETTLAYVRDGRISQKGVDFINEQIRAKPDLSDFPGLSDKSVGEYIAPRNLSFDKRTLIANVLQTKANAEQGVPNVQNILDSMREEAMAGLNWGDAILVVEFDANSQPVRLGPETDTVVHPSYDYALKGRVVGKLPRTISYKMIWDDFFAARRAAGADVDGDRRSFELSKPVQMITAEIAGRIPSESYNTIRSPKHASMVDDILSNNWRDTNTAKNKGGLGPAEFIDVLNSTQAKHALDKYDLVKFKEKKDEQGLTIYGLGNHKLFFGIKNGNPASGYGLDPSLFGFPAYVPTEQEITERLASRKIKTREAAIAAIAKEKDSDKTLTLVLNNETGSKGMLSAVMVKALEEGVTALDAFAVPSERFPDGFLPSAYREFGFEETGRVPFDPSFYTQIELADLKKFWKDTGWDESMGYPDIVFMKWGGYDGSRSEITRRYFAEGSASFLSRGDTEPYAGTVEALVESSGQSIEPEGSGGDGGGDTGDQGTDLRSPVLSVGLAKAADEVRGLSRVERQNLGLSPSPSYTFSVLKKNAKEIKAEVDAMTSDEIRSALEKATLTPTLQMVELLGEFPEYLTPVVDYIMAKREALINGTVSVRDVAKAYWITVASIGADAINVDTIRQQADALGIPFDPSPMFLSYGKKGQAQMRPEELAAWWLGTPEGQTALDNIQAGKFNQGDWATGLKMRDAFGRNDLNEKTTKSGSYVAGGVGAPKPKKFNLRNVTDLVKQINEAKGNPAKLEKALMSLNNIAEGKKGFIGHMLGFGEWATLDAVELNIWLTGKGSTTYQSESKKRIAAIAKKASGTKALSKDLFGRIRKRINALRGTAKGGTAIPEEVAAHVIHHWIWDRAKGIETTHQGVYHAMATYSVMSNDLSEYEGWNTIEVTKEGRVFSPIVRDLLQRRADGEDIPRELIDEAIRTFFPSRLVQVPESPEDLPTRAEIDEAILKTKGEKVMERVVPKGAITPGEEVTMRQDVPSMTRFGLGVVTIRGKLGASYEAMGRILKPRFELNEKETLKIGLGSGKQPHIKIVGAWAEDQTMPADLKDWTQVGFNPDRHSFYYERATMRQVTAGSEAFQIGNTVFVKDPVFGDGNISPISYSVLSNAESRIADQYNPLFRDPDKRRKILVEGQKRVREKAKDFDDIVRSGRTVERLDREQATREGVIYGDLLVQYFNADTEEKVNALPLVDRKAARSEAKRQAEAWRKVQDRQQKKIPRETMVAALRTLDAMISALPVELRGKIGGMVKIATLTEPGAMVNELETRLKRLDDVLEAHLKKEANDGVKKLFEIAKPARDESGKARKGKAGADIHDLFETVKRAKKLWSVDDAEAHALGLEAIVAAGNLTPEEEAHKLLEAELVRMFGGWNDVYADSGKVDKNGRPIKVKVRDGAGAERRNAALDLATDVWKAGYLDYQIKKKAEADRREQQRTSLRVATGKAGLESETRKAEAIGLTWAGGMKEKFFSLLNFEQLVTWVFGDNEVGRWFINEQRRAENQKIDEVQQVADGIEDLFTSLAGGNRFAGEKLHYEMTQRSLTATSETGDVVPLSELEAISALLMWMQEDGKRHLNGKRDENGKIVSKWAYGQDFIDEIYSKLSKNGDKVLTFLINQYSQEYEPLNAVYKEIYGINMPRNANYSPLLVKPQQAGNGQTVDPTTGNTVSAGSFTPGSLRTRAQVSAQPDFRDSIATYLSHKKQIAHWKANAVLMREASGVIGNRDLGDSVSASSGKEAVKILRKWIDMIAQGGNRDAAAGTALVDLYDRMVGRAASMALVGRVGTLLIQSTQIMAASAAMPTSAFVLRLSKLLTGNLKWRDALDSPYMQRRLKAAPVHVQLAMEGLRASEPTRLKHAVREAGQLLSATDAMFTSGTYAIVLDYQLKQAKKRNASDPVAEAHAETERIVENLAQPTRMGTRSFYELSATSPIAKLSWAFGSDARKNLALLGYTLAKGTTAEKARAFLFVVLLNGVLAGVVRNAWRDLRDDEDEEIFDEKYWNIRRIALSASTDWLFGFPIIGEEIQGAIFAAAGEYRPDSGLFSSIAAAPGAFKNLFIDFDSTDVLRDVEKIASAIGLFNDTAAAGVSVLHVIRDVFDLGSNLIPD